MLMIILAFALCSDAPWEVNSLDFEEGLTSLEAAVVGPNDHIYLLDGNKARIFHLDGQGKVIHVFGTRGKGPGEFGYPFYMDYLPGEKALYVFDYQKPKLLNFNLDGSPGQPRFEISGRRLWVLTPNKALVLKTKDQFAEPNQGATVEIIPAQGKTGTIFKSFSHHQHQDNLLASRKGARGTLSMPWHTQVLLAITPDGEQFYLGSSQKLDFELYRAADMKKVGHIVQGKLVRPPLYPEEVEAQRGSLNLFGKRFRAKDFPQPDFKPPVQNILADTQGRLLVALSKSWKDTQQRYKIYTPDNAWHGDFVTPKRERIFHANSRFYWCYFENDEGDFIIAKKRLQMAKD